MNIPSRLDLIMVASLTVPAAARAAGLSWGVNVGRRAWPPARAHPPPLSHAVREERSSGRPESGPRRRRAAVPLSATINHENRIRYTYMQLSICTCTRRRPTGSELHILIELYTGAPNRRPRRPTAPSVDRYRPGGGAGRRRCCGGLSSLSLTHKDRSRRRPRSA